MAGVFSLYSEKSLKNTKCDVFVDLIFTLYLCLTPDSLERDEENKHM